MNAAERHDPSKTKGSFGRDYRMKRIQTVQNTVVFTLCILFSL
jgi:hypothetical protein